MTSRIVFDTFNREVAHLIRDGKDVIDVRRVCMAGDLTDEEWTAFVGRLAKQYPKQEPVTEDDDRKAVPLKDALNEALSNIIPRT